MKRGKTTPKLLNCQPTAPERSLIFFRIHRIVENVRFLFGIGKNRLEQTFGKKLVHFPNGMIDPVGK